MRGTTKAKINPLHIVLLISIFVLFAFYVFSANRMTSYGFAADDLGRKIGELEQRSSELGVLASQAQSLFSLQKRSEALGLQEATKVSYIKVKSVEPLVFGN